MNHVARYLKAENKKWAWQLVAIPREKWPAGHDDGVRIAVLRSRDFLVQAFDVEPGVVRLSVNRTTVDGGRWSDGISWDELQRLKQQAGYGDFDAVEVFPADEHVVNVANMRHLWVFTDRWPLSFVWRPRITGQ